MIRTATDVSCPRCGKDGGHERIDVSPHGTAVTLLCPQCWLSWKVTG